MKFLSDILIKAGLVVEGSAQLNSLAGVGSRMVIVGSSGVLSTQSLPTANITGGGTAGQVTYFDASNNIVSDNGLNYDSANGRLSIGGTSNSYKLNVLGVPDGTIGQVILATTGRLNIYAYHSAQYGVILESKNPNDVGSLPITLSGSTVNLLGTPILSSLIGAGTRMVVTDASGTLSTQAIPTSSVVSVFGRSGTVTAQAGDYNTSQVSEVGNLYYTDARSRAAISVTGSGTYNSSTGVITINGGVTSVNGATGAVTLTTANIGEVTNLYYTDARARAAISVTGSGSYNSTTGVITINGGVTSVNGLTGAVTLTTSNISEGTNLYYTDARARAAISLTTTGSSGASTYSAGVLNIPNYTLAGLGGVGGTVATGQVAFGTAADTIGGSNNLFWDNTNGRLGIGTNAPAVGLDTRNGVNLYTSGTSPNSHYLELISNSGTDGYVNFRRGGGANGLTAYYLSGGLSRFSYNAGTGDTILGAYANSPLLLFTNSAERVRIDNLGNVGIGITPTVRLHVSGDTILRGSGNSNTTTALAVQNSDSTNIFRVRNEGTILINAMTSFGNVQFYPINNGGYTVASNATELRMETSFLSGTTTGSFGFLFGVNSAHNTSAPVISGILMTGSFSPTSGVQSFSSFSINPTINQVGATGVTTGLYVNPTLTAATDWRSVSWSNNTGWGLYGTGTAPNYMAGSLGIGTTSLLNSNLRVQKSITGSTAYFNIISNGIIQSDVTSQANYFRSGAGTANAVFTLPNLYHFNAVQDGFGASSTITNQHGFHVDASLIGATNNYGFYGNIASGTGRWNLYMNGTAANYINGSLLIGSATNDNTNKLQVTGTVVAGSRTSTDGSVILRGYYTNGYLTTFGTDASSGGPMLSYGVESAQNSTSQAFVSSSGIGGVDGIPRSAYIQNGNHRWYTAAASTTPVGTAISMTKHMELYNSGNLVLGGGADDAVNRLQVGGSISATVDSVINGVTIGKGGGSGALNTTVGSLALSANTTGASNTAFGLGALGTITTGSDNVGVGTNAGRYRNGTTANSNSSGGVYIGNASRASAAATTNEIVIGAGAQGNGDNTVTIGNTGIASTFLRGNVSTDGIVRSDASRTAAINDVSIALLGSNITTYAAGFSMIAGGYGLNAIYAQHEQRFGGNATFDGGNITGGGLILNRLAPTAAGTVTMTQQNSGLRVRTMSNLHLQTQFQGNNNLTVTHMSGLHIYGHYRTSGTGVLTVSTAYYGIFLADPNEFGTGATVTGSNYGFYQQGADPYNYFGGKVNIGTTATDGTSKLRISGLPTSAAGLLAGEVWNNGGVLTIV